MLKSLKIKNFQSHEHSELQLHPGINVIIGLTDSGKSAIVRSIRWLSRNKPSGGSFRSRWGGETSVTVETESGSVIRTKDKTDTYELLLHKKRPLIFKAFGNNVPEEITVFLALNEINTQFQLDSHFLLSQSSGQVAEHFNKVAHLDQISRGLTNIDKEIRRLKAEKKYKTSEIEEKEEQLKQFDYLEQFEEEVEVLEDMDLQLSNYKKRHEKLRGLIYNIGEIKKKMEYDSSILTMKPEVEKLLQLHKKKETLAKDEMLLYKAVLNITNIVHTLKDETSKQTRLLTLFEESFPNVCPLCGQPVKKHAKNKRI